MIEHDDLGKAARAGGSARRTYPFAEPPELRSSAVTQHPVVIAGGGPVGLATALELARHGVRSVVLEKRDTVGNGSRAICWAKRTLEICDRLGTAERMRERGVTWSVGRVYAGPSPEPVFSFDLLPDKAQKFPAFVNLQQYYAEEYLIDQLSEQPEAELRWQSEVVHVDSARDGVMVTVRTPAGAYQLYCEYLIAADGQRSTIRGMLALDLEGRGFEDPFLLVDVKMKASFPPESRFWFDPPFNPGQTASLHKQADDVWRLDFQLGRGVDRAQALAPEHVEAKVRGFLGSEADFAYEWVSLHTFQCRRMARFVHGRVIFAGDAAHVVPPFGARGANGGLQDVDNFGWKLALILRGLAPGSLLDSYDAERGYAADESLLSSTRSADFMTPQGAASRAFRDAVLDLSQDFGFARRIVNTGRLSVPCTLDGSPLNTEDQEKFSRRHRPGAVCRDAPVVIDGVEGWFLERLGGQFVGILFTDEGDIGAADYSALEGRPIPVGSLTVKPPGASGKGVVIDRDGLLYRHYDARPGTYYLVRPDQHVAGRWRRFERGKVEAALARATGRQTESRRSPEGG